LALMAQLLDRYGDPAGEQWRQSLSEILAADVAESTVLPFAAPRQLIHYS